MWPKKKDRRGGEGGGRMSKAKGTRSGATSEKEQVPSNKVTREGGGKYQMKEREGGDDREDRVNGKNGQALSQDNKGKRTGGDRTDDLVGGWGKRERKSQPRKAKKKRQCANDDGREKG
ncbi:hypothetical protein C8J57DRAFT_1252963 [Mycena rebaudengoi]|nr:hypothetical protein C8J57DRAFT_1252963 [Mycena rebaudengoi]